jgi:hypothetical protein
MIPVAMPMTGPNAVWRCESDYSKANHKTLTFNALALAVDEHLLGDTGDHLSGGATDHVTDLVRNTGEARTESRRGELVQVDRNNAPCALDHELQEERACGKTGLRFGDNPRRDDACSKERGHDDRTTTTVRLGDVTDDRTADYCTSLGYDGAAGCVLLRKALARLIEI